MKPLIKLVRPEYTNMTTNETMVGDKCIRILSHSQYKNLVTGELIKYEHIDYLINQLNKIKEKEDWKQEARRCKKCQKAKAGIV